jgi:hypothetical protein
MSESLPIVFGIYPVLLSGITLIWLLRLQHRSWPNWAAWVLACGSIKAMPGDAVTMGQPLAEIGNSGNTLEPHLHIEATKDGKPIWLSFNGLSLSINSLITRK